jgi:YggT family protein
MDNPLLHALEFLIDTLFTLYITTFLLRFLLQWVRADFYNPVCQSIIKITNPVLLPVRRVIPGWAGIDWASLLIVFFFCFVNQYLLISLRMLMFPNPLGIMVFALADAVGLCLNIYIFSTLIWVVTSWLTPHAINPVLQAIYPLIAPWLQRIQRFIPRFAGLDLSPVALMIGLSLVNILLVIPLKELAIRWIAG